MQATDVQEYEALVSTLEKVIYHHCYRMLDNATDAEDAKTETFVRARTRWDTYRDEAPREHWIKRISTNICLDMLRKRRRQFSETSLNSSQYAVVEDTTSISKVEDKVLHDQLLRALQKCLTERDYWILLCDLNGMTIPAIVKVLPPKWKMTKDGVKSVLGRQIERCLEKVRREFNSG